jgi:hypothetical protein
MQGEQQQEEEHMGQEQAGVKSDGGSMGMIRSSPRVLNLPGFKRVAFDAPAANPPGGGRPQVLRHNSKDPAAAGAAVGAGAPFREGPTGVAAAAAEGAPVKGEANGVAPAAAAGAEGAPVKGETNGVAPAAAAATAAAERGAVGVSGVAHEPNASEDNTAAAAVRADIQSSTAIVRWERGSKCEIGSQVFQPAPDGAYLGYKWVDKKHQEGAGGACVEVEGGRCKKLQQVLLLYDLAAVEEEASSKQQQQQQLLLLHQGADDKAGTGSQGVGKGAGKRRKQRKETGQEERFSISQEWGAGGADEGVSIQQPLWLAKRRTLGSGTMHGSMVLHVYKTNNSREYVGGQLQDEKQQLRDSQVGKLEQKLQSHGQKQQEQYLCIMQLVPWMVRVWLHTLKLAVDGKVGAKLKCVLPGVLMLCTWC